MGDQRLTVAEILARQKTSNPVLTPEDVNRAILPVLSSQDRRHIAPAPPSEVPGEDRLESILLRLGQKKLLGKKRDIEREILVLNARAEKLSQDLSGDEEDYQEMRFEVLVDENSALPGVDDEEKFFSGLDDHKELTVKRANLQKLLILLSDTEDVRGTTNRRLYNLLEDIKNLPLGNLTPEDQTVLKELVLIRQKDIRETINHATSDGEFLSVVDEDDTVLETFLTTLTDELGELPHYTGDSVFMLEEEN